MSSLFSFARVSPDATLPKRANPTDAGMDLSAAQSAVIPPRSQVCVDTGIAVIMRCDDCYARVAPRSGLAFWNSIDVLAGVVDIGYTNSIKVILYNHGENEFVVNVGDRIAQLVFERICVPSNVPEISYEALMEEAAAISSRGLGGFGSTGIA